MFDENNDSISINTPTEESSFPRKHVRELEIIELRCSLGVLLRWKWQKHWVMKLKNEYQIASTCLFVKSIRQSKQSSFEHVEIFICIKISRYAQGIPTVIKTACCFREWCYFKLQLNPHPDPGSVKAKMIIGGPLSLLFVLVFLSNLSTGK